MLAVTSAACSPHGVVEEDAWRFEISGRGFHAELEEPGTSVRDVFTGDGCARTQRLNGYAFDATGRQYAAGIPVGPSGSRVGRERNGSHLLTLSDGLEDTFVYATVSILLDEVDVLSVVLDEVETCSDFMGTTCTPSTDTFEVTLHGPVTTEWPSANTSEAWLDLATGDPLCFPY
jgi:hypothetical protein